MGKIRNACIILVPKPEGKDNSESLGVDERMILERILRK